MSILDDQELFSKGLQLFKDNNLDNSLNYINKIKNKNLNTLKLLSQIYKKKNDVKNTKIILNKIMNLDKKNLYALYNLGEISREEKNFIEAEKFYLTLISYNENFVPAHFNLASIYEDKGELSLAKKIYLKLVDIDKKNFAVYFNLQRLDEDLITNETIKYINQEIKNEKNLKNKNIAYGHFVLAKNYRKKKNIKKELEELSLGHQIFFNSDPINKDIVKYWLDTIPKMINKKFLFYNDEKKKDKNYDIKPIFIFGIPRSGTTLVETIITSGDERIYNAGENLIFQKAFQSSKFNKKMSEGKEFIKFDMKYFKKNILKNYLKQFSTDSKKFKFIDRTMTNFFFSELLLELFPNAKIINCKRNNFHNFVAIYQQCLNNLPWSHSVKDIKKYISLYNKKLSQIEENHKNNILTIDLKKLTEFPVETSKKIMSFCDLKWSQKVLKYYERKDLICSTASNIQIRKKIFKYDSAKFLPYKEYFDEF